MHKVAWKWMHLYKRLCTPSKTMSRYLRKTLYSQVNSLFFLKFYFGCWLAIHQLLENYRLVLHINDLLIKTCVISKFNGDRRNFLANKTLELALELHGQNLTIQNDSHLKQNLKNVFHSKTCQYIELEPVKIQSAKTAFLKTASVC